MTRMPPCDASAMRARDFHVRREPRQRYALDRPLIGIRGDLVVSDTAGLRRLAAQDERGPGGRRARRSRPARSALSGCSMRSVIS